MMPSLLDWKTEETVVLFVLMGYERRKFKKELKY